MSESDAILVSFALLVVTGVSLFLAISQEWRAMRAIAVLFLISYGLMLGKAVGAVFEVMP